MGMKYLASSICACGYAGEQLGEAEGGVQEEHGHAGEQLGDPEGGVQRRKNMRKLLTDFTEDTQLVYNEV